MAYLEVGRDESPLKSRYVGDRHNVIRAVTRSDSPNWTHAVLTMLRSWPLRYTAAELSKAMHAVRRTNEPVLVPGMPVIVTGHIVNRGQGLPASLRDGKRSVELINVDARNALFRDPTVAANPTWVLGRVESGRRPARMSASAIAI